MPKWASGFKCGYVPFFKKKRATILLLVLFFFFSKHFIIAPIGGTPRTEHDCEAIQSGGKILSPEHWHLNYLHNFLKTPENIITHRFGTAELAIASYG